MVNKIAKIGMLVWTILCFMGSCAGMMKVAQQTQGRELGGAESFGVGIGMFMWLLIWAVPMVVMGIVALVTRRPMSTLRQVLCRNGSILPLVRHVAVFRHFGGAISRSSSA